MQINFFKNTPKPIVVSGFYETSFRKNCIESIRLLTFIALITPTALQSRITIMIDPTGDAKNTGRVIDDSFERSITLQCAEAVQKKLEENPDIRVILTRFPGQIVEPLQHANFANRLNVDLYVSIHAYKETGHYRRMFLFHYLNHPATDYWQQTAERLQFVPYDQAHKMNAKKSNALALQIKKLLSEGEQQQFVIEPVYGFPFKPLIGITAPAIGIELGLHNKNDWMLFVDPIAHSLVQHYRQ